MLMVKYFFSLTTLVAFQNGFKIVIYSSIAVKLLLEGISIKLPIMAIIPHHTCIIMCAKVQAAKYQPVRILNHFCSKYRPGREPRE